MPEGPQAMTILETSWHRYFDVVVSGNLSTLTELSNRLRVGAENVTRTIYTLVAANAVLWGCFVWSGLNGMSYVRSQHVSGYPNDGQIRFYVVVPVIMFAVSLVLPIVLNRTRWPRIGMWTAIGTLFLLLPFGCLYTGGV